MARRSADERREHVLDAAIAEFAARGYHAASTTAIASRAGISQPYIYALYRNKRELFLAAHRQVSERIRVRLLKAAEAGADPVARLRGMAEPSPASAADSEDVLCNFQPSAPGGARGLREPVREEFLRVF